MKDERLLDAFTQWQELSLSDEQYHAYEGRLWNVNTKLNNLYKSSQFNWNISIINHSGCSRGLDTEPQRA